MFMKIYQLIFSSTLVMGTIIAVSASNWFTSWLGLEINLISMIPLMMIKLTPATTETAIKYFLVQAMASLILVFSSVSSSVISFSNFMEVFNIVIFLTLIMKAGVPPLHFWFPQVMKNSSWNICLILLTWQKIAPLMLLSYMLYNGLVATCILMSCAVGALGGLNQMMLKPILTYSSITHSAWMVSIIFFTFSSWTFYFVVYSVISISIIYLVKKINIESLKEMTSTGMKMEHKILIVSVILSLGGLPPMLGFVPKLMAVQALMSSQTELILLALISASLVSLFYYVRTMHSLLLMDQLKVNMEAGFNETLNAKMMMAVSVAGNLIVPLGLFLV